MTIHLWYSGNKIVIDRLVCYTGKLHILNQLESMDGVIVPNALQDTYNRLNRPIFVVCDIVGAYQSNGDTEPNCYIKLENVAIDESVEKPPF